MAKEVMNLQEAAAFLGTSRQTLAVMVSRGEVPCRVIGRGTEGRRSYRFARSALIAWLTEGDAMPEGVDDVDGIIAEQVEATHRMAHDRREAEVKAASESARAKKPRKTAKSKPKSTAGELRKWKDIPAGERDDLKSLVLTVYEEHGSYRAAAEAMKEHGVDIAFATVRNIAR